MTVGTRLAGAPPSSDDILWEIFLRLPASPSSLPRVSLVCKRWRRLAADPEFLLRFRAHHRKAPLLGLFSEYGKWVSFTPTLDPPNRINPERFSMRIDYGDTYIYPYHGTLLGCRHGLVLILDPRRSELLMCDPITGEQRRVAVPREFGAGCMTQGGVLCANGDKGHVHGGCHSSPFKAVLVRAFDYGAESRVSACVYSSSETGTWSTLVYLATRHGSYIDSHRPSTLVGDRLYWWIRFSLDNMKILEFDICRHSLCVIDIPPILKSAIRRYQIIQGEDGGTGLAILAYPSLHVWDWKVNYDVGVATWVLRKTVNLDLVPNTRATGTDIVGYIEDDDAILVKFNQNVFLVHLETTQSNNLCESMETHRYHPFTSFYSPGEFGRCKGLPGDPSTAPTIIKPSKHQTLTKPVRKKARRAR